MTDLVPAESGNLLPEVVAWKTAQRVCGTEFVPQSYRGRPEAVFAAILYGRELGMGPMQALQSLNVIKGKPSLSPEAMRARVFAAGHRIETSEYGDDRVVLAGTRADGATATVCWTLDDARRAGLGGGDNWKRYPRAMLLARATSELCRLLFPDVISGASYTPEELQHLDDPAIPEPSNPPMPVQDVEVVEEAELEPGSADLVPELEPVAAPSRLGSGTAARKKVGQ